MVMQRDRTPLMALAAATVLATTGCAVVSVGTAVVGTAVAVGGAAVSIGSTVVGTTVKVAGKAAGATADALTPSQPATPAR